MENLVQSIINSVKGGTLARLATLTNVGNKRTKGGVVVGYAVKGIDGSVTKLSNKLVQLRASYQNKVNAHLEKQGSDGDFKASSLPFGQWVSGAENLVIEHKGNFYLRFYPIKGESGDEYFVNGVKATDDEIAIIKAYELSKVKPINTQAESGLTQNQVVACNVNFENIVAFKCGDVQYNKQYNIAV